MKKEIKAAIKVLVEKISKGSEVKGDDALKLTQAALNLAHTIQVLKQAAITRPAPE